MIEQNFAVAGLSTDYEITTILGNFSEDYIRNIIGSALEYKFRPFGLRSPDYPFILKRQFDNIRTHSTGHDDEIREKEDETYFNVIKVIAEYYNLSIDLNQLDTEDIYTLCYYIYKIFCEEFTDRMVNMITNYIIYNKSALAENIKNNPDTTTTTKTNYSDSMYHDPDYILIYDNMQYVLQLVASLDISFEHLIELLADTTSANYICRYMTDNGDIYKNYVASYILNQVTSTEVLSAVRLDFVNKTIQNVELFSSMASPYIEGRPVQIQVDPTTAI